MGGSDRPGRSLGDTSELERRAKEILREGSAVRRNVFISFCFEDLDNVNLLRAHAKNENSEIEFCDFSVREPFDSERAEYIRQRLTERISQSSTTIVYLSELTPDSKWVEWEVRKSFELGKRVIAIHTGDTPPSIIPEVVRSNKVEVIPWSKLADWLQ